MQEERALIIALDCLGWLASHAEELDGFMAQSGVEPVDLQTHAADPDLLVAALDYLMGEDARLLKMCADIDLKPQQVTTAHHLLSGSRNDYF